MATIIIATQVDPTRVGLTYKISIDDWAFEEWWDQKLVRELVDWEFSLGTEKANTGVIIFREGMPTKVHNFTMTMPKLVTLLQSADYDYPNESGRPGRPEKRVLVSTTSKERRQKSSLVRQTVY